MMLSSSSSLKEDEEEPPPPSSSVCSNHVRQSLREREREREIHNNIKRCMTKPVWKSRKKLLPGGGGRWCLTCASLVRPRPTQSQKSLLIIIGKNKKECQNAAVLLLTDEQQQQQSGIHSGSLRKGSEGYVMVCYQYVVLLLFISCHSKTPPKHSSNFNWCQQHTHSSVLGKRKRKRKRRTS